MAAIRNFSHNSNFVFQTNLFEDEETIYGIQGVNLPGVNFTHVQVQRSAIMGNIQGDTMIYNDLSVQLIMDEKLVIWKSIMSKLQKMREPGHSTSEQIERMGYLIIQDDNANQMLKLEFTGMMIESIDDLQFASNSDDEIITCGVTIKYDYFTVV